MKEIKPPRWGSLKGKVLRLLGTNRGFAEPSGDKQKTVHAGIPGNNYYNYRKEIETAWFEAERKKAKGLVEWQKRRLIC